jgi:hypothetical protein
VADISEDHRKAVLGLGFEHLVVSHGTKLPLGDGEFDVVLANSVVEHATLPQRECRVTERVEEADWRRRARAGQRAFAEEVRRVGRGYFVQTPHKHFPIDQHVHLPFVQYLSHNWVCRLVSLTDRVWIKHCQGIVDWELLTDAEMVSLFPDGAIHVERTLGLPKSVVAWRRPAT